VLLEHDARADVKNDRGETPLHVVSRGKYDSGEHGVGIARLLLRRGLDVHAQDIDHDTPLHSAAFSGMLEVARVLLDHGANVNVENMRGRTPLHQVAQGKYDSQAYGVGIARLLLERGADVNARMKDRFTPLHSAAFSGRLEVARVLLDHGANTKAETQWSDTPLHIVSRGKYDSQEDGVAIVQLLLEHGVDIHAQNTYLNHALHFAAFNGKLEIARLLLDLGANPNVENDQGGTPLHLVSEGKYDPQGHDVGITRLLLDHGVDVNARKKNEFTPLHSAAFHGKFQIAQVLSVNYLFEKSHLYFGMTGASRTRRKGRHDERPERDPIARSVTRRT
jgi:hypothetical protein